MKLVLAMDLRNNLVVHGKKGERAGYRPLDWGCSPTAEPVGFVQSVAPKFLYIADLDRIEGTGSHDDVACQCAREVDCCYVDRGCRAPDDFLCCEKVINIVGTETGGQDLGSYPGGFLSIDMKDGKVIPSGADPAGFLKSAREWNFDGCILLNVSSVGTETGVSRASLERLRASFEGTLFYGGGVANVRDLETLSACGFDGAIIATALHHGTIPLEWIRKGSCC